MAVAANLVALIFVVFITFIVVKGQWLVDFDEENYDYGEGDPFKFDFGEEEEEEEKKEEKPCAPPPDIRNGQTRVWGGGLLLEYICNSTYYAVGPTHGACDLATGQWTINPPLCVESKCPSLVAPNRGVVNMDVTGGVATFTCRQGFYLIGSRVLLCEGGKWTGIYPVCVVNPKLTTTTPSPPVVSKGDVSKGDVIKTLVTTATPVTEDLSFVNSDETCFHGHVEPPALENAVVEISYVMNEARGRYVMVATYTCFAGHKLLNQTANKLFCKDHKWGASITPQCVSENDPCALNNGECEHICVPSDTTYQCTCSHGYTLQSDGKKCEDVDECVIENGGCQQECHNTHASYFCSCYQGYAANGPTCIDIDECSGKHACPGECINAAGSYQCQCQTPGYRPSSVPTFCEDVDECAENKGGCQDVCVNKWGTYKCRCEQRGLRLAKDNHSCEDVDECKRYKTKVCRHGVCSNTDGSFVCTCKAGFSTATDRSSCIDVDECEENNGGCQQVCNNTMGSFHCGCHHGYVLDKSKVMCSDVDECVSDAHLCEDTCVNTPGGFTCICTRLGHVLGPDNRTCVACEVLQYFDDSAQACRFCPAHAHAIPGKVALSLSDCVCDLGFRGSPADMQECKDVDECGEGYLRCSHTCVNIPGTAFCACPTGYVVDSAGRSCEDLDECREDENGVVKASCNQVCMNTPGSYTCQCRGDGYTLQTDGHTCTDENECKTGAHNCSHKCVNTDGGFVCECRTGYFMDEDTGVCTDVNECFLDQNPCRQLCNNTEGSYECSCYNAGFRLSRDGTSCVDINECMEGDNPCPDICINTVGSFTCDCNRQGYRLAEDSSGCLDIDECDDAEPHGCEQVCVNTPGAFTCDCRVGYRRVGPKGCQACPQGMYRPSTTTRCQRCPARSTTNGTAKASLKDCHCDQGYTGNPGSSKPCNDYDECDMANFGCQHRCVNTVGSAYCTCNAGFVLSRDRKTCNDVDECANGRKGRCHQVCVNTVGGYTCNCTAPYYTLNRNGYSCDDVDECQTGQRHCEHRCVNTLGGARCSCPYGYRVHEDGTSCDDIDECARSNGGCEDVCTNTVGSFECACTKTGFSPSQDNRQCVDINECLNRSLCEGRCENLYGSYRCHCTKPGTTLGPDGHSCQDVDECQNGTHKCDQLCVNTDLSYRCDCFPGFNRQEDVCVECPVGTLRDDSLPSNESCHSCPPNMTTAKTGSTSRKECICKNGYSIYPLLGTNCRDINECAQKNGGCEDKCQNSRGSFTCTCGPGYTLADDNKSCFRSSCPSLSSPSHGRLVPMQCQLTPREDQNAWLTPGTVCSYRCRRGYKLRGHAYRTCLPNATWTGQPPTCKVKTCSVLKPPTNGYLLPAICRTGPVPFRKRCKFRCGKNFRLRGKSGAKCLANQRWSTDGSSTRCVPVGKTSKKTANEATVTG